MLTVEAHSKQLQPDACGKSSCLSGGKSLYFYATLSLYALGTGGVRGALPALGADQFDQRDPNEAKDLATFFNWLILSSTIGSSVGVTAIVWVNQNKGWHWGFMIATIATFVGLIILAIGKPFFRLQQPNDSPIIRILQVQNRLISLLRFSLLAASDNPRHLFFSFAGDSCVFQEQKAPFTRESFGIVRGQLQGIDFGRRAQNCPYRSIQVGYIINTSYHKQLMEMTTKGLLEAVSSRSIVHSSNDWNCFLCV